MSETSATSSNSSEPYSLSVGSKVRGHPKGTGLDLQKADIYTTAPTK